MNLARAKSQLHHISFPIPFELIHIFDSEHFAQGLIAERIFFGVGHEIMVVLREQSLFLRVVAKVPSLRVVCPGILPIELMGCGRA